MISFFLGVALVAAPFFIKDGNGTTTVVSQEYFLILAAMLGSLLFGIKTNKRIQVTGLCLFALAFTTENPFGMFQFYQLILSIAGVLFIAVVYGQKKDVSYPFIKKCLGVICLVESAWIIFHYFGIRPHGEWMLFLHPQLKIVSLSGSKIFGSLGNINHSAALIACTLPFIRPLYWVLPALALYLGNSTMPVLCAIVGIFSYYSYKKENYYLLLGCFAGVATLAISLLLGLFGPNSYFSDTNRIKAWKLLLNDVGFQIWGKGFGYIPAEFSRNIIGSHRFYQAHNEWLELYTIAGLLGIGVGVYLILPSFKNRGNPEINACLIALLLNSLGNFTFHIAPLFMVFGACYALQLAKE